MSSSLVGAIASAIARVENTNPSLNNPGGLMDVPYYKQTGLFRLAQYSTPQAGEQALESTVTNYVNQGNTLDSFFGNYAPYGHGSNDPAVYAQTVSGMIGGVPTDVPLNTLGGTPTYSTTAYAMAPTPGETTSLLNDLGNEGAINLGEDFSSLTSITNTGTLLSDSNWGLIGLALVGAIALYKIME